MEIQPSLPHAAHLISGLNHADSLAAAFKTHWWTAHGFFKGWQSGTPKWNSHKRGVKMKDIYENTKSEIEIPGHKMVLDHLKQ